MRKRSYLKKIAGVTLSAAILATSISYPVRANQISLTINEVNQNQTMFSKTYMYEGEEKTVYIYNSSDGTAKMTGDIPYTTGSGYIQVRSNDGYIEVPFHISDATFIVVDEDNSYYPNSTLHNQDYAGIFVVKAEDNYLYAYDYGVFKSTNCVVEKLGNTFAMNDMNELIDLTSYDFNYGYFKKYIHNIQDFVELSTDINTTTICNTDSSITILEPIVKNNSLIKVTNMDDSVSYYRGTELNNSLLINESDNELYIKWSEEGYFSAEDLFFDNGSSVEYFNNMTPTSSISEDLYSFNSGNVLVYFTKDLSGYYTDIMVKVTSGDVKYDELNSKITTDFGYIGIDNLRSDYFQNIAVTTPQANVLNDNTESYSVSIEGYSHMNKGWVGSLIFDKALSFDVANTTGEISFVRLGQTFTVNFLTNTIQFQESEYASPQEVTGLITNNNGVYTFDLADIGANRAEDNPYETAYIGTVLTYDGSKINISFETEYTNHNDITTSTPITLLGNGYYNSNVHHNAYESLTDEEVCSISSEKLCSDGSSQMTDKGLDTANDYTNFLAQDNVMYLIQGGINIDYNLALNKAGKIIFSLGYTFEYIRNAGVDRNIYKGTLTTPEQVQNARKSWEDSLYDVYNHYLFLGVKYIY